MNNYKTDEICKNIDGCISTLRIMYKYLEKDEEIDNFDFIGMLDLILPTLSNCCDEVGEIALKENE